MNASAESPYPDLPPGKASPAEPQKNAQANPSESSKVGNEEPAMLLEPDLPSDGRDEVGEAMIRDLPQRPELSEPPSQPDPSTLKP